jgi:hypothetical protein
VRKSGKKAALRFGRRLGVFEFGCLRGHGDLRLQLFAFRQFFFGDVEPISFDRGPGKEPREHDDTNTILLIHSTKGLLGP